MSRFPWVAWRRLGLVCFTGLALSATVVATTLLGTEVAYAAEPVPDQAAGIMVLPFEGPRSEKLSQASSEALVKSGERLVPAGTEGDVALGDAPDAYVAVARKHRIKAYLDATVSMSKTGWILQFTVRNAKDGSIVGEPAIRAPWLPGLLKKIEQQLAETLSEALAKTELPAAEPTPEAESETESEEKEDTEEDAEPDRGARPSPLDAHVGLGLMYREVTYVDPVSDVYEHALQPPNVGPLTLRVAGHWYPAAHFSGGFAAHLGLAFSYYRSIAGVTEIADAAGNNKPFDTTFSELNLGGRYRIPVGSAELGLNAGWGTAELTIAGDNEIPASGVVVAGAEKDPGVVPDAAYTYLRFGPDFTFPIGSLQLNTGVYYRVVTLGDEPGQWKEPRWFPEAEAQALELQVSGVVPLSDTLGVVLGVDIRQYGLSMNTTNKAVDLNPVTGMPIGFNQAIAGGATDLYFGAFAGLRLVLPGQEASD